MPIDVHCISDDNSFFSTSDGALHMGDGGVDDGEDSDVTVHEFGHATQAAQVPGFGPNGPDTEQRAMGEGFGDFLAAYIYLQDGNATYQSTRRFCVAEWDAASYNTFDRPRMTAAAACAGSTARARTRAPTSARTPASPRQEHADGRFWSAMLTCVFNGIEPSIGTAQARDRMLTLVLAHHSTSYRRSGQRAFADSLAALRAEDQARIYDGDEIELHQPVRPAAARQAPPVDTTPPVVDGALTPGAARRRQRLVPDGSPR